MATLRAPGRREARFPELPESVSAALGGATVSDAIRVEAVRGDAELPTVELDEEGDILALELEGGLLQFINFEDFKNDYGLEPSRDAAGGLFMPAALGRSEVSRGIKADLALRFFRVIGVPLDEQVAVAVAGHFEKKLQCGLRAWREPEGLDKHEITDAGGLPDDAPILVFLHGTASSTLGSFGALPEKQPAVWDELHRRYRDRMFAFEHRTLTESPIENVIDLLERLPQGARLHVVSHSRGGLLGELLCRADVRRGRDESREPFDPLDREQFRRNTKYESQLGALEKLNDLLLAKQPRVERFVRVACPAAGTLLASKRLDRYFSVLVNVIGRATGIGHSFVFDFATSLAIAAAKERTDPETLPGIEAMVPASALVKVLNRPGVQVPADLSIIAGDIQGAGLWRRLKVIATDLFYREDHDLVVHTRAMYGGTSRTGGARAFFDKGSHVSHFNYFVNKKTADQLLEGLTRKSGESAGFDSVTVKAREARRRERGDGSAPQGIVFVLPGIMGSHLGVGGDRIWLDPAELARGKFVNLDMDARDVEAQGLIGRAYADLVEHLSATYDVIPFPYDWRLSLLVEGRRLGEALEKAMTSSDLKIGIVAHSMGGVLARAMIAECGDVWKSFKQRGGRVVMLGAPNGGTFVINSLLLGRGGILGNLARLDFRNDRLELLQVIRRFRGLLELLPMEKKPHDYLSPARWQELHDADGAGWVMPVAPDLEAASRLRDALSSTGATIDPERMTYVAGRAPSTPVGVEVMDGRLMIKATAEGDGRVPWATGLLADVETWYVDAPHGKLADHRPAFPAIVELLETGDTQRLRKSPPVSRGSSEPFDLPEEEPVMFPNEAELEGAALGFEFELEHEEPESPIRVEITHGDLAFATHPVLMGHYQEDVIVGAERILDSRLGGKLQRRRDLGNYAGQVQTASVVLADKSRPPGAIIVGLGPVGELTPGDLRRTITRGLSDYAIQWIERHPESSYSPLSITSILVGSGEGGLSLENTVRAILEAADETNGALLDTDLGERVRIDHVELLEIHLDRAVQTSRVLKRLLDDGAFNQRFDLSAWRVNRRRGGWQRVTTYEQDPDWWTRLQITENKDNGLLKFVALTDRARAETRMVPTQRSSLDAFLREAVQTTQANEELTRTLFELLVPNELKEAAPQERDVVIVVDKSSARYPWELLQGGADPSSPPIAVRSGLIRQMQTSTFRNTVVSTSKQHAFVVGDPPTKSFAVLGGAKREAEAVWRLLEDGEFEVEHAIRPESPNEVFTKLFAQPYRVMHLAGHGVYEHEVEIEDPEHAPDGSAEAGPLRTRKRKVTGMVLADDVFLTPAEVNQMRTVPELVFINCCHLGWEDGTRRNGDKDRFHHLAANLGTQLIENGARAVVAAGWAVRDDAALIFASTFYENMLKGVTFGKAVTAARENTWSRCPDANTWGAYQCYGDPGYVLVKRGGGGDVRTEPVHSVIEEATLDLANLKEAAESTSHTNLAGLRVDVRNLAESLPDEWMKDARLLENLGGAYGEVGLFEDAVRCYEEARKTEKAVFSVKSIEQLANLRSRWAVQRWKTVGQDSAAESGDPMEQIQCALDQVDLLLRIGKTRERYSLKGGACKRKAWITRGKRRDDALASMGEAYRDAYGIGIDREGKTHYYPTLNWLTAWVLARIRGNDSPLRDHEDRDLDIDNVLTEVEASIKSGAERSFWDAIALIDSEFVRRLHAGDLAAHRAELAEAYARERARASARMFSSVLEHLEFVSEVLSEPLRRKKVDKTRQGELHGEVTVLAEQLSRFAGD